MSQLSNIRNGNFTSSEIVALISRGKSKTEFFGKPAHTYIRQCNLERRLGRSLETDASARSLTWGTLLEKFTFEQLGLEYTLTSNITLVHPDFPCWVGSPDGMKEVTPRAVTDIKCPYTLQSFCDLVEPIYKGLEGNEAINWVRENHKDGEKYYWQIVSNAILSGVSRGELIVFMPYQSQLSAIREAASNVNENQNNYAWIGFADDNNLPHLIEGGYYKNLNRITFDIPQEDVELLTASVKIASGLLEGFTPVLLNQNAA